MLTKTTKFSIFSLPKQNVTVNKTKICDYKYKEKYQNDFDVIFVDIPYEKASNASLLDRKALESASLSLIYGEILSPEPIFNIFALILKKQDKLFFNGAKFYDLGSGSGRPVVAAALLYPFESCTGIEILPGLFNLSVIVENRWNSVKFDSCQHKPHINFLLGSFLNINICNWLDGDVVFANSTCFNADMMRGLYELSLKMKIGSIFITLSYSLATYSNSAWQLLTESRENMSWYDLQPKYL